MYCTLKHILTLCEGKMCIADIACISASNCIYFCFEWNGLLNACVLNKFFIYVLYSLLVYLTVYNLTTSAFLTWKQITFLIPKSTDKDTINCTV